MKHLMLDIFKRTLSFMTVTTVFCMIPFSQNIAAVDDTDIFYDDFTDSCLDMNKWMIAEKNWGGTVTENGEKVDYNGGVISENVAVRDGNLVFTGLGNLYEGEHKQ